jgi:hypothetical protein
MIFLAAAAGSQLAAGIASFVPLDGRPVTWINVLIAWIMIIAAAVFWRWSWMED